MKSTFPTPLELKVTKPRGEKCQHQFFETNKIEHKAELDREQLDPNMFYLSYSDDYGVQTTCALCTERRQVWQSGKVNIYNKKKQIWEAL